MKISQFRKTVSVSISVSALFFGFLVGPVAPAHATSSYSVTKTYTSSLEGTIARVNGIIYGFKDSSHMYAFNEATDTLTTTVNLTTTVSQFFIAANDKIVGFTNNGNLYYFQAGVESSAHVSGIQPCGAGSWSQVNGITASDNYLLVTCYTNKTLYLFDVSNGVTPVEIADAKLSWTPLKAAIANGYAYIGDLTSGSNVRKISLASLNSYPYTLMNETTTVLSSTTISAGLDIATNPFNMRLKTDASSVWATSASGGTAIKLTKIDIASNAVSTTTLTDYVSGVSPRYALGDISSDGTTVFLSFGQNVSVVAFDIGTSTPSLIANPSQTSLIGMQVASNSFWVSGPTGFLRYSLPAVSNSDGSAEERRKRQAAIDAARLKIVTMVKNKQSITNTELRDADMYSLNPELVAKANAELAVAGKSSSFGFKEVDTVINKYSLYQDIENSLPARVTGRATVAAGILPKTVPFKQLLIKELMNSSPYSRQTVAQIDELIAEIAKAQLDRKTKVAALLNKTK